jgi:hypothetical protein
LDNAKNLFDKYIKGIANEYYLISPNNAIEIVANAAILARFKIEALNIFNGSQSLTKENKELAIKTFFGPNTEYGNLYKQYYDSDGYVGKAQKIIKDDSALKPVLDPQELHVNPIDFDDFDDIQKIFTSFAAIKEALLQKDGSPTLNAYTNIFDDKNIERAVMGLALSDPKQIGLLLALLGDKENNGEIKIQKQSLGAMKYTTIPSKRLLVVAALGISSLAKNPIPVIALIVVAAPSIAFGTGIAIILSYIASVVIWYVCLKEIRTNVEKERSVNKNMLFTSAIINFFGTGISTNDIVSYVASPSMKKKNLMIRERLTKIENYLHDMVERCKENDKVVNQSVNLGDKIKQIFASNQDLLSKLKITVTTKKGTTKNYSDR